MNRLPELTSAYNSMNPWARGILLALAVNYAARWPKVEVAPPPHLTLAYTSPTSINKRPHLRGGHLEKRPPVLISHTVDG